MTNGGSFLLYGAQNGTESETQIVMTGVRTVRNLFVSLTVAPGVGNSRTFTVRKNGVDTALTLTLTDGAIAGSNIVSSFTTIALDLVSIRQTRVGAAASVGRASVEFT